MTPQQAEDRAGIAGQITEPYDAEVAAPSFSEYAFRM